MGAVCLFEHTADVVADESFYIWCQHAPVWMRRSIMTETGGVIPNVISVAHGAPLTQIVNKRALCSIRTRNLTAVVISNGCEKQASIEQSLTHTL